MTFLGIALYALAALSCTCGVSAILLVLVNSTLDEGDDQ